MTLLEVRGLVLRLGGRLVLRGVGFRLEAGEAVLLRGPNGAGKTSLLRVLAGLERPDAGEILWRGRPVGQLGALYRGRLAWVGHRTALYPRLTGRESLLLHAAGYPWLDRQEARRRAELWLERAGLLRWAERPVSHYSRGMQQRLAIARSFLTEPELILLDEAAGGLDETGRRFLRQALDEARARGAAAIVVSHEPDPGLGEVDRRWWLEAGRLCAEPGEEGEAAGVGTDGATLARSPR
ncbi:MAG: heme ABC exporter ATP-binding protein CcmA [Bacillota bacterium]|nr:heme ABC exporter ATP-binding protein CcmA [Bacillota bacterium]